ncbi:MAG: hypothetical protein SOZ56_03735 [Oscillospiraceae bacterium]|nr:hypothetical protein [Oscillospiraceae bacterium]
MKQKRFLSALTAFALVCGLVGCQADIPSEQGNTEKSTAPTASAETAAEEKYSREYDENGDLYLINNKTGEITPPFPEDWSGERISKMVTIDGYQLTLPCKVSDILALSEEFRADEPQDNGDGTSYFQIWYNDVMAVSGSYRNDDEMITDVFVGGNGSNKYIKIEGVSLAIPDEIFSVFKDFRKRESGGIKARYVESDMIYIISFLGYDDNSSICIIWEDI